MDWNALKVFNAIESSRSLTEAAQTLGMSDSTVYRRLNDFEAKVGRLFDRVNGQYQLTEAGVEMRVYAQRIANSFDDIERQLAGKDRKPKGVVKVTAPSSFAYNYLPQYLSEFNRLYSDIAIELLVSNQELNMTNRHADIALRVIKNAPEHLVGRQLGHIRWGIYASSDYLDKHGRPKDQHELTHHKLIGASGTLSNHQAFSGFNKKYGASICQRSDDFVAMSFLAEKGNGLALLPDDLARAGLERLFTFEAAGENALWLLTHPDLRKVERIKIVMKYLNTSFSQDPYLFSS